MANNVSGRQWILDTASATPIWKYNVKIVDANWYNGVTVGDTVTFQDLGGRSFTFKLNQVNYPFGIGKLGWMEGFTLVTITSGVLYLIIDK